MSSLNELKSSMNFFNFTAPWVHIKKNRLYNGTKPRVLKSGFWKLSFILIHKNMLIRWSKFSPPYSSTRNYIYIYICMYIYTYIYVYVYIYKIKKTHFHSWIDISISYKAFYSVPHATAEDFERYWNIYM